jgi:hypothetical protein
MGFRPLAGREVNFRQGLLSGFVLLRLPLHASRR